MSERDAERVTHERPCEVCKKTDWCMVLSRYYLCMRIESNKPHPKGGWLHPKDSTTPLAPMPPKRKRISDQELTKIWSPLADKFARSGIDRLPELAVQLGVSIESLVALRVGYAADLQGRTCWTFPERNARGEVVGIVRRLVAPMDGRGKLCCKGSRRGLSYCDGWDKYPGAIWLVEGGSDTAAALTLGIAAIGRPSNRGGVDQLCPLLARYRHRKIVVMGERDAKSDLFVLQSNPKHPKDCPGCQWCWPGKWGMEQVARLLATRLQRAIVMRLPCHRAKDLRSWLQSRQMNTSSENDIQTVRHEFLQAMNMSNDTRS